MPASAPVLAATDFSPPAELALERAAHFARARGLALHVVHVYNDFAWGNLRTLLRMPPGADVEAEARARLEQLADALAARHGLQGVAHSLVVGRAAGGITATAHQVGAGLIVLGAHGEGIVQELALGGTAIKVLRASGCPVLVCRLAPARDYARAVVATDFSATSTRALRLALSLLPDAELHAVHACTEVQAGPMRLAGASADQIALYREHVQTVMERKMAAFIADADIDAADGVHATVRAGYAAAVLLEETQALDADLLVIGKHGASALDERVMGSITLNLMHHAACDVLMVP